MAEPIYSKDGNFLVATTQQEVRHTKDDLLADQQMMQAELARVQARLAEIDTLLAECTKLGL